MSELEERILNALTENPTYYFSQNMIEKSCEKEAVKSLENSGLIYVRLRTIGYVVADVI